MAIFFFIKIYKTPFEERVKLAQIHQHPKLTQHDIKCKLYSFLLDNSHPFCSAKANKFRPRPTSILTDFQNEFQIMPVHAKRTRHSEKRFRNFFFFEIYAKRRSGMQSISEISHCGGAPSFTMAICCSFGRFERFGTAARSARPRAAVIATVTSDHAYWLKCWGRAALCRMIRHDP